MQQKNWPAMLALSAFALFARSLAPAIGAYLEDNGVIPR